MGINPVVPNLETPSAQVVAAEAGAAPAIVTLADAGEYEEKFLATAQLLQSEIEKSARLEKQLALARIEMGQYAKDLQMWVMAHASEYPARRVRELQAKLVEIEAVK